jgi:hypothetical protein
MSLKQPPDRLTNISYRSHQVLHFKVTPESMQREKEQEKEILTLRNKCRTLETELSLLKAEAATSSNLLVDASKFEELTNALNVAKAEASALEAKLKDKEKSLTRLSEVRSSVTSPRRRSCLLFWWFFFLHVLGLYEGPQGFQGVNISVVWLEN